jgi:thiamine biosynthesis protein ThiI
MAARIGRVFGVQSVSFARSVSWSGLEDIVRKGSAFGSDAVRGKRFAVRARNVGDDGPKKVRSFEVERALGAALFPVSAGVDLDDPEATVFVEIMPDRVFLFSSTGVGAGGLPLGTEGKAVSLISGGFDSPVASWRMLRRGIALDYVFCNLGGRTHQLETMTVAKRLSDLWQRGTRPRFHAFDFDPVSREIQQRVQMRYWQIVLKRMMLRAAEAVAAEFDAPALVTGDALGQVSSQTLQNLSVISEGARFPILRPLIGHNKEEIISESKRVGTHDLSARVGEYCAIVPTRPATHALFEDIEREEARMDPSVLEKAIAARDEFRLDEIDLEAWEGKRLATDEIGSDDIVIDLRSKQAYDEWHYPEALSFSFGQALEAYGAFAPESRYVLYCEFGLKSAHLADLMGRAGLRARHVSGGLRAVQELAEAASR